MHVVTRFFIVILILTTSCQMALGQEELPKNQLGIWFDNDFFVLTDRYYTFGLGIEYSRRLSKGFFNQADERLRFQLYQKAYTPDDLRVTNLSEMERRYAGFLGFETHYAIAPKNNIFEVSLLLGIVGPSSGAGGFQRWYHDNIVRYVTPTWANEIPDEFHSNISFSYRTEIELSSNPFGVWLVPTPEVTIGTKDTFWQLGGEIFFGRKSAIHKSMAYHQMGDLEKEIYFSFSWNHRWVERNAFLEQDVPGFQQQPEDRIVLFSFKFHHRFKKNEYRFGYYHTTSEAEGLKSHRYVGVSYVRGF